MTKASTDISVGAFFGDFCNTSDMADFSDMCVDVLAIKQSEHISNVYVDTIRYMKWRRKR